LKRELIHPNRTNNILSIQYSPDGKRIIAGGSDGVVVGWDVATGKELTKIETGYRRYRSLNYFHVSPDWKTLFVSREKEKRERMMQGGKRLIRYEFDGEVRAWDLATGELRRTYKHQPPRNIIFMNLSPDGTRFLTYDQLPGTYEQAPRRAASLWDVQTGQYRSYPAGLQGINLCKDWRTLAFASLEEDGLNHFLKVIDVPTGQEKLSIPIKQKYGTSPFGWGAVSFSPDGRALGFAAWDEEGYTQSLKLFDLATSQEKLSIPIHDRNVTCGFPQFSPDGRLLVGYNQVYNRPRMWKKSQTWLTWWDAATGREIGSFALASVERNRRSFFSQFFPQFLPDGQTFSAVAERDGKAELFLFREPSGQPTKTLVLGERRKGEQMVVRSPAFSPDGKWLALLVQALPDTPGDFDVLDAPQPRIHLIDLAAGSIRETLVAPQGIAVSACFSPDGKTLATGGYGRVLLWDVANLPEKKEAARMP
jgi:WD40 repeat protein